MKPTPTLTIWSVLMIIFSWLLGVFAFIASVQEWFRRFRSDNTGLSQSSRLSDHDALWYTGFTCIAFLLILIFLSIKTCQNNNRGVLLAFLLMILTCFFVQHFDDLFHQSFG